MPGAHFSKSEIKAKYLEQNPNYTISENENQTLFNFDEIENDEEYEVWLVQCPKNMNLKEQLENQSIKLPGKTRADNIETISEEFSNLKPITIGYNSNKNYRIKTLTAKGRILIREKLKTDYSDDAEEDSLNNNDLNISHVPLPTKLTRRHPLLGAKFEDKLTLSENIKNRLEHCDEIIEEPIRIKKEIKTETDLDLDENNVVEKTTKKKKRKANDQQEIQIKSKKVKTDIVSGDEESLAWIKKL